MKGSRVTPVKTVCSNEPRRGGVGPQGNNLLIVESVSSLTRWGRPERKRLVVEGLALTIPAGATVSG